MTTVAVAAVAAVVVIAVIVANSGDGDPNGGAAGTTATTGSATSVTQTTSPATSTSAPAATTTPTTTEAPATTEAPVTTAAPPGDDIDPRLLRPSDVGLEAAYEISDDPFDASQTTLEGDYPIDCGGSWASVAFQPEPRVAITWRTNAGDWYEVIDVFPSTNQSTELMDAVLDQLDACTNSGGGPLRPLTWLEGVSDSTPVQNLGDETWSGESLLGGGDDADHTIFTVTRVDNIVIYTQLYSFSTELDREDAWELARAAVARATG
jgi:hypothetical protein